MVTFNREVFVPRVKRVFDILKNQCPDVDSLVVVSGDNNPDVLYSRTQAMQHYLFEYGVVNTIYVFGKDNSITVYCSPKTRNAFSLLADSSDYKMNFIERSAKGNEAADCDLVLEAIHKHGTRVGVAIKDRAVGALGRTMDVLLQKKCTVVDVGVQMGLIMQVKDAMALDIIKASAKIDSRVFKETIAPALADVAKGKSMTHLKLSDKADAAVAKANNVIKTTDAGLDIIPEDLDNAYTAIIQSSNYDLRPSAQTEDTPIRRDTIVASFGVKCREYCSNVARTYFCSSGAVSGVRAELYACVQQAVKEAEKAVVVGGPVKAVYEAVEQYVSAKHPDWASGLTKHMGAGIGLEFRESQLALTGKNAQTFEVGVTLNICVGINDVTTEDKKTVAVMLADTYVLEASGLRKLTNVPDSLEAVTLDKSSASASADADADTGVTSNLRDRPARVREQIESAQSKEDKRVEMLRNLAEMRNEEALQRFEREGRESENRKNEGEATAEVSYSRVDQIPSNARPYRLAVHKPANTILCPINNQLVPFHISMVKNVQKHQEGDYTVLRIQFITPDAQGRLPTGAVPSVYYVRELSYRTKGESLGHMFASVQALRKEWVDAVKKEALKSSLVAQESLKVIKDAPVRLRDIMCRPALSKGKRVLGTLIAHANGFRYITVDRAYVDVIYANIKACVLQRADKRSNFVIIHLELYNPILISNKKSSYVQFYVELGTGAHDLDNNFYGDDDEARQEEEDRQKRRKWNERFANFARSTENQWEEQNPDLKVEFDIPDRKKAFQGVPNKTVVELVPTDHCLVALEDYPPTVVAKSEIELISLERVNFNLREFDLVVIYKEFTRSVTTISSIPTTYLDMLKQWLGDSNILYIESVNNTNWKTVLEDIRKDVRGFYEEGGWLNYFVAEDDEDEEIAAVAEASGSDFQLSEVEDESSSDDFESDGSSASDDDDSFSSAGEDEDSEGADWDELERRAAQEDRRRGDDDEPAKKPKKRSK